ncbi:unnamed protein product, partial [Rotaria sp. Silwood1]
KVIGWLAQSTKLTDSGRRPLISIVHNIARHDDGADELNKYGAIDKIKEYIKIKLEKTDSRVLTASMALALLSTPEELKRDKKGMNIVLNQLLQIVIDAAKSDRYRRDGFHVSEPLGVLVKMFVVEERTFDYVLCHAETQPSSDMDSTIRLFASLLFKFADALKGTDRLEQFTLIALLNIFWSISFQEIYASELIQDQELIITIQKFVENDQEEEILEQYKPRKDLNIARKSLFACISQLNHPNMRYFLQLTTEQQNLPENKIYHQHVYYLLLISAQTISFLPFATIEDQQFIENHAELYSLLIEHIEQSMPEHCQTIIEKKIMT